MAVPGFPNLFVFYGPNTNQGGNSIILILEAQAGYVRGALGGDGRRRTWPPSTSAPRWPQRYDDELQEALADTVWASGCHSYFTDSAGRVVTQLPQTSAWYAARTARFELDEYELTPAQPGGPRM